MLAEAEQTDKDEDKHYGRNRREERLPRIAEAKEALEARARAEAEEKQKDRNSDKNSSQGGGSQRRRRAAVEPKSEGAA